MVAFLFALIAIQIALFFLIKGGSRCRDQRKEDEEQAAYLKEQMALRKRKKEKR